MNKLYYILEKMQLNLFPHLKEELGPMTDKEIQLIKILEVASIEDQIICFSREGRPPLDRKAISRSFVAKAFYNLNTNKALIQELKTNANFRRICGFERIKDIPTESTLSRAFSDFSTLKISEITHSKLIKEYLSETLIGHISRDATAIEAREKPLIKEKKPLIKQKKGRPKKEEIRESTKETVLEKQKNQCLSEMLENLPTSCDVGCKKNSNGYKNSWTGYKLHIDTTDCEIPVSCILTSASVHDSQVALPLGLITAKKVTSCYDLMDAAYDSPIIREHCVKLGHVPIIDINPRRNTELKNKITEESKKMKMLNFKDPEKIHYNARTSVERTNARLKDEFGGRTLRVKGAVKVMSHLMFGILVLTVDQLIKLVL